MGAWDWLFKKRADNRAEATSPTYSVSSSSPVFAVLDVETTGLSPNRDRILELAIVRVDALGNPVDEFTSRVDPEGPVGATHIHGITAQDVAGKPRFRDLAPTIAQSLHGLPLVAHNAKFDLAFLRSEFRTAGWDLPWLAAYCTLDASFTYLPDIARRRLADCCWAVGTPLSDAHSALGDARATAGLLRAYIGAHRSDDDLLRSIRGVAASTAWPTGPTRSPQAHRPETAPRSRPARITPPRPRQDSLVRQLNAMSLLEVLDEGAPPGTGAYLELLFTSLEDGDISHDEAQALDELRTEYSLTTDDLARAHEAFMLALAHRAVDDGIITHDERRELHSLATLLSVPDTSVKAVLDSADEARRTRLSANLGPLPDGWSLGEPLHVGDKVVFTGCDERQRQRLETRAEQLGVRVVGSVSRLTAMLVTDGSFSGGKHAKAVELGTRTVHPDDFEQLLRYLQPSTHAASRLVAASAAPAAPQSPAPQSSNQEIRAWALANGHEVGVRGRLPRTVIDAFVAHHGAAREGAAKA
ncbi:exonuclease domain-containing protein [Leifsonia sp. ZF2019]|uniref:exonuclease domain-containing protein n=1 Tax=Leifsonia sp. ZF2019 TaxID=2781978 RepID=UPI001CC0BE53|nr:histone-like nucleoid-structuring protein Lsr2 [Leifsonia sp. ZF2019]